MASACRQNSQPPPRASVVGGGHHRYLRVLDRHHRLLEVFDRQRDLVIGPFGDGHGNEHQVGARGKHRPFVRDDEPHAVLLRPLDCLVDHGKDIVSDGVHLGVEFEAEDSVPQVEHRGSAVLLHHHRRFS